MGIFLDWVTQKETMDPGMYKPLPVTIGGTPVYISRDAEQLVHDNQIIGEIQLRGPDQKPTVFVTRGYADKRAEIQSALDQFARNPADYEGQWIGDDPFDDPSAQRLNRMVNQAKWSDKDPATFD